MIVTARTRGDTDRDVAIALAIQWCDDGAYGDPRAMPRACHRCVEAAEAFLRTVEKAHGVDGRRGIWDWWPA